MIAITSLLNIKSKSHKLFLDFQIQRGYRKVKRLKL
jgi:hypothetical protein